MNQAKNYDEMRSLLRLPQQNDKGYQAALYLLSTDDDLTRIAKPCISEDGIAFQKIKNDATWLGDKAKQVVEIANNLFNSASVCSLAPADLAWLGYPLLEQVCNSLFIAGDQCAVVIGHSAQGETTLTLDSSVWERNKQFAEKLQKMEATLSAELNIDR